MKPDHSFDRAIDRHGTASVKWDRYRGRDVIPLWVADTDFAAPPPVLAALRRRVDHGVFGYGLPPDELTATVRDRLAATYAWDVPAEAIVWLPGLVSGLSVSCRAFADPDEGVLTTVPIYPPFLSCPPALDRAVHTAPLSYQEDGRRWVFDWVALEAAIRSDTRVLLLCSPHNPCGRIWERGELERLAEICARRDLVIVSDEIHNQLLLAADRSHVPTATLGPAIAARTVTLMAPSKTYNLAGLGCSFAVIEDAGLRRRFTRAAAMIVPHPNVLGYTAALAAYLEGDAWLAAQLDYLRENRDRLEETVATLPGVSMAHVEATYLGWIDCRGLNLREPPGAYFERFGLGFSDGGEFSGKGFVRFNFGCTRVLLDQALERFARAVKEAV